MASIQLPLGGLRLTWMLGGPCKWAQNEGLGGIVKAPRTCQVNGASK